MSSLIGSTNPLNNHGVSPKKSRFWRRFVKVGVTSFSIKRRFYFGKNKLPVLNLWYYTSMNVITNADVKGKKVLVRGDTDVKVQSSSIEDGFRLKAMVPTLKFLLQKKAKVILIGHLGRPKGKFVKELSLAPISEYLNTLDLPTHYNNIYYYSKEKIKEIFAGKEQGKILLLENLRFGKGEEENNDDFARELSSLADIYVNECFATSHRKHASFVGIPKYLPSFAGLQFAKEIETLSKILENPARPLVFVMGGAKIETKIPLTKKISKIADTILLGGLLMFAKELEGMPKVRFPVDSMRIDDIGPKSIAVFGKILKNAKTIVWNGPMGKFEEKEFAQGTKAIAELLAEKAEKREVEVIVGGGDTIAALDKFGLRDKMSFVSTGGGSMLQFLADGTLPGIEALEN